MSTRAMMILFAIASLGLTALAFDVACRGPVGTIIDKSEPVVALAGVEHCDELPHAECVACLAALIEPYHDDITEMGSSPEQWLAELSLACPAPVKPPSAECEVDGCPVPCGHACAGYCGIDCDDGQVVAIAAANGPIEPEPGTCRGGLETCPPACPHYCSRDCDCPTFRPQLVYFGPAAACDNCDDTLKDRCDGHGGVCNDDPTCGTTRHTHLDGGVTCCQDCNDGATVCATCNAPRRPEPPTAVVA